MEWLKALATLGIAAYFFSDGLHLVGVIFVIATLIVLLQNYQKHQQSNPVPAPEVETVPVASINLEPELEAAMRSLLESGKKLEAITEVRRLSGASLKQAKDYVDSLTVDSLEQA